MGILKELQKMVKAHYVIAILRILILGVALVNILLRKIFLN